MDGYGFIFFHMNWGWDGDYNDVWYGISDFKIAGFNFSYQVGLVTGIKP